MRLEMRGTSRNLAGPERPLDGDELRLPLPVKGNMGEAQLPQQGAGAVKMLPQLGGGMGVGGLSSKQYSNEQ